MSPDLQEALSYSYAVRQNIVRLRSGNYAVFGHYDYSRGVQEVAHIGPWAECERFITEYVPPVRVTRSIIPASLDLELDL